MRKVNFISPTSLSLFYSDRTEYYLKYLCEIRPPKFKQTEAMSVGSAFDAYIKDWMSKELGVDSPPFEEVFKSQVEEHNREWALDAGKLVFDKYREHGALSDLMSQIDSEPIFESKCERTFHGVPLFGYPDAMFRNKEGGRLILDWKVNGFCSKRGGTRHRGYLKSYEGPNKPIGQHKDTVPAIHKGFNVGMTPMDCVKEDWATQLAIYGWLLGEKLNEDFVVGIDQLLCKDGECTKVVQYRGLVSKSFQGELINKITDMWEIVNSGWIFRDKDEDASRAIQKAYDDGTVDLDIVRKKPW